MNLKPLIRGAVVLAALLPMAIAASAAERVTTRAALHDNYARIVLEWPRPVAFEARIEGDVLRVTFPRALETDLSPALKRLPGYLESAKLSADGRSVLLRLARPLELKSASYGARVVLDLAPVAAAVSASPATVRGTSRATNPVVVAVRRGEHTGFSRLVFDWPRFVDYRVDRKGAEATLTFSRPGQIDLSALAGKPLRFVRRVKSASKEKRAVVVLTLAPGARLRNFRWGNKVVIDVLGDGSASRPAAAKAEARAVPEPPAASPRPVPRPPRSRDAAPPVAETAAAAKPAEPPPTETSVAPEPAEPPPTETSVAPEPADPPPAATSATPEPLEPLAVTESPKSKPAPERPRNLLARGAEAGPGAVVPARSTEVPAPAAAPEPNPPPLPKIAPPAPGDEAGGGGMAIDVVSTAAGPRIRFNWSSPVAAAIFLRGNHLWVVFDRHVRVDLSAATAKLAGIVVWARQLPNRRATVLRFKLEPGRFPKVRQWEATWLVDLVERSETAKTIIRVLREPHAAVGARLFLPVIDLGEPIELTDPEAGDRLVVVPLGAPTRAVPVEQNFLELKVLATAHGVAVVPGADGVAVRALRNGVSVGKEGGLMLSSAGAPGLADSSPRLGPRGAPLRFFHFKPWQGGPASHFVEIKQELLRKIAMAAVDDRNDHRLRMAQFFFAHGFAADAKGIIETIEENDPEVLTNLASRALRGALNFLLQRFDEAAKDLRHPDFDGHPEMAVWRAALAAENKDWPRAKREFGIGLQATQSYPRDLRIRFLLLEARTALATNEVDTLDATLVALAALAPPEGVLSEVAYLRGRAHERMGRFDTALESYQKAIASDYRPIRARAELARVNLLSRRGELTARQVIDRLDGLRFVWRGDDFELSVLRQLGELYVAEGSYRKALESLRKAVAHFPKDDATRASAQRMNEIFALLFLEGAADAMTAISALALYYEFRELTPTGAAGDEMIQRLADRLVAIDLLGRAAKLLEHQVEHRLDGADKARVGARLAVIYLLDSRPGEALVSLTKSSASGLEPALAAERRRLEARALADLERYEEALSLLGDDSSPEGWALRGEVHWRAGDWEDAARIIEAQLGERWQLQVPLDEVERQQLMQLAVSFALAADQTGLDRVRLRYRSRLGEGADADAFRVVTSTVDRRGTEFSKLAGHIAEVGNLQAFMTSYREKLASGALSAIN